MRLRPATVEAFPFPRVMAVCVVTVVAFALVAQISGARAVISATSDPIALNAISALCLVLAGAVLWQLSGPDAGTRNRIQVLAPCVLIAAAGAAGVLEHLFHFELGIGGRMPLVTAVDLILFAIALLATQRQSLHLVAQLMALAVAVDHVFLLIGHAVGSSDMTTLAYYRGTSALGDATEILLFAGVFALRPGEGLAPALGVGSSQIAIAAVTLLALTGVTAWAWYAARQSVLEVERADFGSTVAQLKSRLEERVATQRAVMVGITSFLAIDPDHIDRRHWHEYIEKLHIESMLSGVRSVGYAPVIARGSLERFVNVARAKEYPTYAVWPARRRNLYVPVLHLEPSASWNTGAIGFDMYSEPVRRKALDAAADVGGPVISDLVDMLVGPNRRPASLFLMIAPYYNPGKSRNTIEERRTALVGFVFTSHQTHEFFSAILGDVRAGLGVEIHDGGQPNERSLMYRSVIRPPTAPRFQSDEVLSFAGHQWTLRTYSLPEFSFASRTRELLPAVLLLGGLAISLLLVGHGIALARVQSHSKELARQAGASKRLTEALTRSNIELQRFAYVASHDLQSPLRSISGFTHFLREALAGKLDAETTGLIDRINAATLRMQAMITDLLEYARVDSKAQPFAPVDLSDACNKAIEMLHSSIAESNARIEVASLPVVNGDAMQLCQVFQNLIANAVKYRGESPPLVSVTAERRGSEHLISVRDNGIGIAPAYHEQIFDMFKRLHTQDAYPGSGIGLAVCKRVLNRHDGRIWVESAPGAGSLFRFTLPFAPSQT